MARAEALGWPEVQAPGKVVLAGEWGVLAGGDSLVMAVDRFAVVDGTKGAPTDDWERRAFEVARECAGLDDGPEGLPHVDSTALYDGEHKLGLGSSAAFVAAVTGSVFAAAGHDLDDEDTREEILAAALRAHRLRGGGSGIDVAALVFGGLLRYRLAEDGPPSVRPVTLPPHLLPIVVYGGEPVSTAEALRIGVGDELLAEAVSVGDALCTALENDADVVPRVRAAAEVLGRIAAVTGTPGASAVERATRIAEQFGGAAKPSGAGGGDLVLVWVPAIEPSQRSRVTDALSEEGLEVAGLSPSNRGVSRAESQS